MRPAAILLTVILSVSATVRIDAAESYKEWWKYLKGEWTYEINVPDPVEGQVTYRLSAKGNAILGRFKDSKGVATELAGWRADTKTVSEDGYGSNGGSWHVEYKKFSAEGMEGDHTGVLPDGQSYKGRLVAKKTGPNHWEWKFQGKTGEGKELTMTGKFSRKTE